MDIIIVLTALTSFILFLFIHIVLVRLFNKEKVIVALFGALIISYLLACIPLIIFFLTGKLPINNVLLLFIIIILSAVIYLLISLTYTLAFFGITVTSVRVRILSDIVQSGSGGLTTRQILVRYNKTALVQERLKRLTGSKDIQYSNNRYRLTHHNGIFSIPAFIFDFFWKIYAGDRNK